MIVICLWNSVSRWHNADRSDHRFEIKCAAPAGGPRLIVSGSSKPDGVVSVNENE